MTMTPRLRKLALTTHVTLSVGWLGAVAAFLALSIAGLASHDAPTVRASYLAMNLIGMFIIVPMSLAAVGTGLVQALGTEWGLHRYYWVLVKFILTVLATILLLLHQFTAVAAAARRVAGAAPGTLPAVGQLGTQLLGDSALALLALLVITTLSVFKPWGRTLYGLQRRQEKLETAGLMDLSPGSSNGRLPIGLKIFIAVIVVTVIAFKVVLHLISGGPGSHFH